MRLNKKIEEIFVKSGRNLPTYSGEDYIPSFSGEKLKKFPFKPVEIGQLIVGGMKYFY